MRVVREAVAGIRRAPLLSGLSIAAIGLSLLVIGLFALAAHNVDMTLADVESRVEVVAYLYEGASDEQVALAQAEITSFPEVDEVVYVSKVEALYSASRELTEFSDVFSDLEVNPLPASLEVRLAEGHRDPDAAAGIADRLASYTFVEEVRYGREWVDRIYALRRIAGGAALILGGSFAVGAVLLIGIAVRMAVLARSREIAIMKTVGATDAYIRRPFLFEGMFTGLAGGIVALALTYLAYTLVDRTFLALSWIPDTWIVSGLAFATLLGMGAAARAVVKELKHIDVY